MKEEFLHFIWQNQYLQTSLETTTGSEIVVKKKGQHNKNSGPDFLNAHIEIDGQHWVGNVEIHLNSSDWNAHKHQHDKNYNNVILHAVWNDDKPISMQSGHSPVTLELKKHASPAIVKRLNDFSLSTTYPCEGKIDLVDHFTLNSFTDRLIVERFEERNKRIQNDYIEQHYDLNESFYRLMALAFGQKINQMGFDLLSKQLPLKILSKHSGNILEIESLVFGVAGFLEKEARDGYQQSLIETYAHLKRKYNLEEVPYDIWSKAKLRPSNFPAVRLAQFSALVNQSSRFLHLLEYTPNFKLLKDLLSCKTSPYWRNHYGFEKESVVKEKNLSENFTRHLIINAFLPFYFYFKRRSGGASIDMVQDVLLQLPSEKNSALAEIEKIGLPNKNALQSQAFYHLHQNYCTLKKCLNCRIGHKVLNAE